MDNPPPIPAGDPPPLRGIPKFYKALCEKCDEIEAGWKKWKSRNKPLYWCLLVLTGAVGFIGASPIYYMFSSLHRGWLMMWGRILATTLMVLFFASDCRRAIKGKTRVSWMPWVWVLCYWYLFIFVVGYDPGNLKKYTKVPDYIQHCPYWSTNIAAQYDKSAGTRSEEYDVFFRHRSQFMRDMLSKGTEAFLCEDYDWSVKFFKQADALDISDNSINQFYPFYAGSLVLSGKTTEGTNKMEHLVKKIRTGLESRTEPLSDAAILQNLVDNLGIVCDAVSGNPQDEGYFLDKSSVINDLRKRLPK